MAVVDTDRGSQLKMTSQNFLVLVLGPLSLSSVAISIRWVFRRHAAGCASFTNNQYCHLLNPPAHLGFPKAKVRGHASISCDPASDSIGGSDWS